MSTDPVSSPQETEWKELNQDLITSKVCLTCASCCKTTTHIVKTKLRYAEEYVEYGMAMWDYPKDRFKTIKKSDTEYQVYVTHKCVQLNVDNSCKLYDNRPYICKKFNCFWSANIAKRLPENYDHIKKVIGEIHDKPTTR